MKGPTMNTAEQQLDDILDARAELRRKRIALNDAKIALNQAKTALSETKAHWEDLLTEVEQKQGRLSFEGALEQEQAEAAEAEAEAPAPRKRGRPRTEDFAGGPRAG